MTAAPVMAQSAPAGVHTPADSQDARSTGNPEEIIVTGTRRIGGGLMKVQTAPEAVSSITGDAILNLSRESDSSQRRICIEVESLLEDSRHRFKPPASSAPRPKTPGIQCFCDSSKALALAPQSSNRS